MAHSLLEAVGFPSLLSSAFVFLLSASSLSLVCWCEDDGVTLLLCELERAVCALLPSESPLRRMLEQTAIASAAGRMDREQPID